MSAQDISVWVIRYRDRPHFTMRYVDPITGRQCARSTGTSVRRDAERLAAKWEAELREGKYQPSSKIDWTGFRERYEQEKAASLSENSLSAIVSAFNHVERVISPDKLASLNASVLSRFQAKLREEGMRASTIACHLRHLRAALSWAVSMGLLPKVPTLHMPQRPRGQTLMRGRPITLAEFQLMLTKVIDVRPRDADAWKYHLNGLWLSGLRLDESLRLSWDDDALFVVNLSGRHPQFRIYAEAEKGRQDRLLPITPDFAEFLLKTPRRQRTGFVFPLKGIHTGQQMTSARAGRVISEIGELTKVMVNKAEGKFATAT